MNTLECSDKKIHYCHEIEPCCELSWQSGLGSLGEEVEMVARLNRDTLKLEWVMSCILDK